MHDIPIVLVTQQDLAYLELMKDLDLEIAGEFPLMAATLIHIKSRLLLPRPNPTRTTRKRHPLVLAQRLIEYQRYKAAAESPHQKETVRSAQWMRSVRRRGQDCRRGIRARASRSTCSACSLHSRPSSNEPGRSRSCTCRVSRSRLKSASSNCRRGTLDHQACGFDHLFADVNTKSNMIVTFLASAP